MTWTAPYIERRPMPQAAGERDMLQGWLDFHRDALLANCAGLTAAQLARRSAEPSTLTLLGLVRHLTDVERAWFRQRFARERIRSHYITEENLDADFDDIDPADAEAVFAAFRDEIAACDAAVADRGLDEAFSTTRGHDLNLRWIYTHLIEEYARHNGHADLLRERIDGAAGS
ncbi:DinB family protein [Streptomyces pinistramenti]|uniref:DinB family protein n=1 Tax=Streptomyces pinistramenti TaxID=2884812 RepID=UPI001D099B8E|nr:DinB family protein [Streptomyces pinistramenti]MCB5909182.1 DinB family protein [Streptomyces pinistramenti]